MAQVGVPTQTQVLDRVSHVTVRTAMVRPLNFRAPVADLVSHFGDGEVPVWHTAVGDK